MRYVHTNIVARDWKKLSAFYVDVFGCTVLSPERNLSGDWLSRAVGVKDAALQGVHLLLPGYGENGPTLEIFTYAQTADRDPMFANHQGFAHIAFEVDDVHQTHELALRSGAQRLGEVTEKVIEGRGTLTLVYFRDPEGNIVEILSMAK